MKPYIDFLILIIIAVAAYTVYGIVTFKADKPREFVFNEPKVPPEFIRMDEANANSPEAKMEAQAIDEARKALDYYTNLQEKAPQQASDTISLLVDRMGDSGLPLYFLSAVNSDLGGLRKFETLQINVDSVIDSTTEKSKTSLNCSSKKPMASIIMGTSEKDVIGCDIARDLTGATHDVDVLLIGGPENDQITDSVGNRVVNGGTGDDVMKFDAGRTIIVLDASWGKDTLTVDCKDVMVSEGEIPKDFPIPWVHKTNNFIILGNSINPADIEWRGNVLANKVTGDTLTVNQNCFTVIPKIQ